MEPQREPDLVTPPELHTASTGELLTELVKETGELIKTEMALARAEARQDLKTELRMAATLSVAALFLFFTVQLLLWGAVFALWLVLPLWAAALIIAGGTALLGILFGIGAWVERVKRPLPRTTKTLQENVRWAKERLA